MSKTLGAHRAAGAQGFGMVLSCSFDEQYVRVDFSAQPSFRPGVMFVSGHLNAVLSRSGLPHSPGQAQSENATANAPGMEVSSCGSNPFG
ncbi:hypothetical protein [Streptomyces sp. NPDC007172]|uniref:hypothetical protein n=1 Tax=Streptomyces sp. NPDC007172 TaxID=3364776 RepID=UPI0036CDD307